MLGIFRDAERDDRFVWLRGFADMASRRRGLEAFYGGPVWQRHRDAANATMLDSDDVHLLRRAQRLSAPAGARRAARRRRLRTRRDDRAAPELQAALTETPQRLALLPTPRSPWR